MLCTFSTCDCHMCVFVQISVPISTSLLILCRVTLPTHCVGFINELIKGNVHVNVGICCVCTVKFEAHFIVSNYSNLTHMHMHKQHTFSCVRSV